MNERNVAAQHTQGNEFVFLLLFMFVDLSVFERRYLSTHKKTVSLQGNRKRKWKFFFVGFGFDRSNYHAFDKVKAMYTYI